MDTIIPCRSTITDRFPIASFVIRTPRQRYFEVACATDPRLFHTDYAGHRSPQNFYSSRHAGVLCNERGDTTWMVPPQTLRRFAGAGRLYYALATYGGRSGEDPRFSIAPHLLERIPSIAIGSDFTGKSLDRRRVGAEPVAAAYGARSGEPLRWGGDAVLEAERAQHRGARVGAVDGGYDDGYDPGLWRGRDDDGSADDEYAEDADVPEGLAAEGESDDDEMEDGAESYGFVGRTAARACGCGEAPAAGRGFGRAPTRFAAGPSHASTLASDADIGGDEYEDGAEFHRRNPNGMPMPDGLAPGEPVSAAPPPSGGLHFDHAHDDDYYGAPRPRPTRSAAVVAPRRSAGAPAYGRRDECPTVRRHASYRDADVEESLPVGPAAHALGVRSLGAVTLDIPEKVRLLRIVARADSGAEGYGAVAIEDDGSGPAGLSWGLLLFSQCGGSLGRVLRNAAAREQRGDAPSTGAGSLASVFGEALPALLRTTDPERTPDPTARLAPVDGHVLWEEPWLARFRAAGALPQIQAAQHEEAVVEIVDRILPIARGLGLVTPRQLALVLDRAIHMGVGGAASWILGIAGPIRTQADRAAALAALGAPDLAAFQRGAGLEPDGRWNASTHAAIAGALRGLGAGSPIPSMAPDAIVGALLEAARGTDFADRMHTIADNTTDFDDTVSYALG